MAKQKKNKRIAEKKIGYREKLSGMDTVEGTLIVRTVVKWFSVLSNCVLYTSPSPRD